jgi:hypothetical protein
MGKLGAGRELGHNLHLNQSQTFKDNANKSRRQ